VSRSIASQSRRQAETLQFSVRVPQRRSSRNSEDDERALPAAGGRQL